MVAWVVIDRRHLRPSRRRSTMRAFPLRSFTSSTSFIFHPPYLLPSSVCCKSFACHSYENCRGVYPKFPIRNSRPRPSASFPTSISCHLSPLYSHSSELFCAFLHTKKNKLLAFNRFRTLRQKTQLRVCGTCFPFRNSSLATRPLITRHCPQAQTVTSSAVHSKLAFLHSIR